MQIKTLLQKAAAKEDWATILHILPKWEPDSGIDSLRLAVLGSLLFELLKGEERHLEFHTVLASIGLPEQSGKSLTFEEVWYGDWNKLARRTDLCETQTLWLLLGEDPTTILALSKKIPYGEGTCLDDISTELLEQSRVGVLDDLCYQALLSDMPWRLKILTVGAVLASVMSLGDYGATFEVYTSCPVLPKDIEQVKHVMDGGDFQDLLVKDPTPWLLHYTSPLCCARLAGLEMPKTIPESVKIFLGEYRA
jgi:hypothetical protein